MSHDLPDSIPNDLPVIIPRDIQNIIDEYSSSYDHYLLTRHIITEYHDSITSPSVNSSGILFHGCSYNWRYIGYGRNDYLNEYRAGYRKIYNKTTYTIDEDPALVLSKNY